MAAKKSTDVMIAGKVYTLSGYEEEGYLQRVASYINAKISEVTECEEYRRISNDMRAILVELNIADDYFKARTRYEAIEENYKKTEKDLFDLKHELVETQMKVEELLEKLDKTRQEKNKKNDREQELEEQYKQLEDKYQLLLNSAKEADERNRRFEEILRLGEQEKRDLLSANQELRVNKEKLETALANALFGAEQAEGGESSKETQPARTEEAKAAQPAAAESENLESKDLETEDLESEDLESEDLEVTELLDEEKQERDAVFSEISDDDDPEIREIAEQIAALNRLEKAEKNS